MFSYVLTLMNTVSNVLQVLRSDKENRAVHNFYLEKWRGGSVEMLPQEILRGVLRHILVYSEAYRKVHRAS